MAVKFGRTDEVTSNVVKVTLENDKPEATSSWIEQSVSVDIEQSVSVDIEQSVSVDIDAEESEISTIEYAPGSRLPVSKDIRSDSTLMDVNSEILDTSHRSVLERPHPPPYVERRSAGEFVDVTELSTSIEDNELELTPESADLITATTSDNDDYKPRPSSAPERIRSVLNPEFWPQLLILGCFVCLTSMAHWLVSTYPTFGSIFAVIVLALLFEWERRVRNSFGRYPDKMADTAKFVGHYKLTHSENFDAYMKTLNVGFALRTMGSTVKSSVQIAINGEQWSVKMVSTFNRTKVRVMSQYEWTVNTVTMFKTSELKFKLDQPLEEETMDGRHVKTTFSLEDGKLVQRQKATIKGEKDSEIVWSLLGEKELIQDLIVHDPKGPVTAKRYYHRE